MKKIFNRLFLFCLFLGMLLNACEYNPIRSLKPGDAVDSFQTVLVYYNGAVSHVAGRNVTEDGYNLGLKYQCVEFVKRYYYEHLHHKMPDSYGHAKSFFNPALSDGDFNKSRALLQFANPSKSAPKVNDLIIFDGHAGNAYGHVAIISAVSKKSIEIIQQNPGSFGRSRATYKLKNNRGLWEIKNERVLGRLRKVD